MRGQDVHILPFPQLIHINIIQKEKKRKEKGEEKLVLINFAMHTKFHVSVKLCPK